jgi:trimeric autotransporter adhesin
MKIPLNWFAWLFSMVRVYASIHVLALLVLTSRISSGNAACNTWQPGDGVRGLNDKVHATILWNRGGGQTPVLVAGGEFPIAGTGFVNHIAYWDGNSWQPLGNGTTNGVSGGVYALAVLPNGDLVVGGNFASAGGVAASDIARFDGTGWHALGSGMGNAFNTVINTLAVLTNGDVVAGGYFQTAGGVNATNIARWNGSTWSALGDPSTPGPSQIYASAVAANGDLFVIGSFTMIGGVTANGAARWNGVSWNALGTGGGGGSCIAILPNQDVMVGAAVWNGSTWKDVNTGLYNAQAINAVAVLPDGTPILGGQFSLTGSPATPANVAYWNGTNWAPFGVGVNNTVMTLTVLGPNSFVAGGILLSAGGHSAAGIARWDGANWNFYGSGFSSPGNINAFVRMPNGDVIAGGSFTGAGIVDATNVARWNGQTWLSLGLSVNGPVRALAVMTNGNLVIGGTFSSVNGVTAQNIAEWDGTNWFVFNPGTSGGVYSLAVLTNGDLIVGGIFGTAGTTNANGVARWDGTKWYPMGSGLSETFALHVQPNGDLFAGGYFLSSGSSNLNYIAQWDGSEWISLAGGMNNEVQALATAANGDLLAGGSFGTSGSLVTFGIAEWNGSACSKFGSGVSASGGPAVESIAVLTNENIVIGGNFSRVGSTNVNDIAIWNGSAWDGLDSGTGGTISPQVFALLPLPDGGFVAGGAFTAINGRVVNCFGHWGCPISRPLLSGITTGPLGSAFSFQGAQGWTYSAEFSTNLQSWVTIATGLSGTVNYQDANPARSTLPLRYYRVVQQ